MRLHQVLFWFSLKLFRLPKLRLVCFVEKVSYRPDDCVLLDPPLPRLGAEYEWELVTRAGAGQYVAIALSEDDKMGEDLVIACGDVGVTCHVLPQ